MNREINNLSKCFMSVQSQKEVDQILWKALCITKIRYNFILIINSEFSNLTDKLFSC